MNRNSSLPPGSPVRAKDLTDLYSLTQLAKGMLATLELGHRSLWTKKYERTPREHLRILLLEVTDAIGSMESILNQSLNRTIS